MDKNKIKTEKRERRHRKIRANLFGTPSRPRLSVFRSNKYIYAELINDETGTTLVSASSLKNKKGTTVAVACEVGKEIAKKGKEKKLKEVVFDRGGYVYTGQIKALADGAREGGLIF